MEQHYSEQGNATITSKGIQFYDTYYSCPRAIQQQWFNSKHIGTLITIRYNPSDLSTILIMKSNTPLEPAMALPNIVHVPDDVLNYYRQLEILKKELRSLKSKR